MPYDRRPWVGEIEAATRTFCTCGESGRKPFCDGSHKHAGNGKRPVAATLETTKSYAICMCGRTATPPFCDRSHRNIP